MSHLFNSNYTQKQNYDILTGGSFWSGAKNFTTGWANRAGETGKAYYGSPGLSTIKAFIPDFTDSMSQLDSDSDDFRPDLYNALSAADKATLEDDKGFHASDLAYAIPFIGLFQDTREGWDELFGNRHPEILDRAIENYNKLIKKQEAEKAVQNQIQHDKDLTDQITKNIMENVNNGISSNRINSISDLHQVTRATPINPSKGRGYY